MNPTKTTVRPLATGDVDLLRELNALFATAFADPASYARQPPGAA